MKLSRIFTTGWPGDSLALLAGALLTLSFAPFHLFFLAVISPALLLGFWLHVTPLRAFFRGWLYGLGLFSTGVYWVYISIHTFGHASFFLSTFITVGFIAILALFPAMNGYLLNRFFPGTTTTKIICAFPAIWVLLEWIRSFLFTGFPWLSIGYSQTVSPLKGLAPIVSVYGVSLAIVMSASLIVNAIVKKKLYIPLFAFVMLWLVSGLLSLIVWTSPLGAPIPVSLVQGNIPQDTKWSEDNLLPTLHTYESLSKPYWQHSKIIIWPEGAIPVPLHNAISFIEMMSNQAFTHQATLITGIPIKAENGSSYYNAVIAIGEGNGKYLKRRLVPFGEYTPFANVLHRLLTSLDIPMSDFIKGDDALKPLEAAGIHISAYICYEIAFAEQVRNTDPDIGMIITVSDDAWFGHSIAQAQHLQIAVMRALETGRPVLSVSNDGLTAIIAPNGHIQSEAPPYTTFVLTDNVQPRSGLTPWQHYALDPVLLLLIGMLYLAFKERRELKLLGTNNL